MYISPSSLVPLTHITPILLNSTIPRSPSLSHSPAMHLSVLIINGHLLPPRTDSFDVNPSSTISSPTLRPMPALPQELPPLSCPLPPTSQYPPPGADDTDPDSANVAMAAGKLCGLDQRYWFSWSHPPTTHGR
jgi:hypothetical protein